MSSAKKVNNMHKKTSLVKDTEKVNISSLKTFLGKYLKKVRSGEEVIVLDRQQPIAKLISYKGDDSSIVVHPPTRSREELNQILRKIKKSKDASDSLSFLLQDRGDR